MPGLGWIPDLPDFRDYRLKAARPLPSEAALPAVHSNRAKQSAVRDQLSIGSCVGMSAAAAVEYLRRTDLDDFSTIYSPLYLYYRCREFRGWQNEDTGAHIRDAMKVLANLGGAQESSWPYRPARFARPPSRKAEKEATRWQLGAYHRCDTLQDVLGAIAQGMPVVGGFTCYSSLFTAEVDRTGVVPMPGRGDRVEGGHAVLFTGYDQSSRLVEFKNSWSEAWGDGGYGRLPFAYLMSRDLSDDFWALSEESEASFRGEVPEYVQDGG
jgi:C1A family cysteine protease